MQQLRFLFEMALLYMFRVTISPIIRSTMLYMATGELAHCKLTNSICYNIFMNTTTNYTILAKIFGDYARGLLS